MSTSFSLEDGIWLNELPAMDEKMEEASDTMKMHEKEKS